MIQFQILTIIVYICVVSSNQYPAPLDGIPSVGDAQSYGVTPYSDPQSIALQPAFPASAPYPPINQPPSSQNNYPLNFSYPQYSNFGYGSTSYPPAVQIPTYPYQSPQFYNPYQRSNIQPEFVNLDKTGSLPSDLNDQSTNGQSNEIRRPLAITNLCSKSTITSMISTIKSKPLLPSSNGTNTSFVIVNTIEKPAVTTWSTTTVDIHATELIQPPLTTTLTDSGKTKIIPITYTKTTTCHENGVITITLTTHVHELPTSTCRDAKKSISTTSHKKNLEKEKHKNKRKNSRHRHHRRHKRRRSNDDSDDEDSSDTDD